MKSISIGIIAGLTGHMMYLMTDICIYQIQTWFLIGLALTVIRLASGVRENDVSPRKPSFDNLQVQ